MKLMIIGLDGATFDIIKPLIREKILPNIESLMNKGAYAEMLSTIPPITGPAWLALATGLNPGKTGIIDFLNRRNRGRTLRSVSSGDYAGKAFWDLASRSGIKVGVFNYPGLYPPYELNGFMVSGLGSPKKGKITYPYSLQNELNMVAEGYEIKPFYYRTKSEEEFRENFLRFLEKNEKVVFYLLDKYPCDLFIGVISLTDWLQHAFWKHWDANHPLHDSANSDRYRNIFMELWGKIDSFIGKLLEKYPGIDFFIVSDHGFGPQYLHFNLAKWLVKEGYMVISNDLRKRVKAKLSKVRAKLPGFFRKHLKMSIDQRIDFEKSKAFCLGHTVPFGAIYVNREKWSKEYYEIREEIYQKLQHLGKSLGRENLKVKLFLPEEIYSGPYLDTLPDIIFTINDWSCTIEENDLDKPILMDAPFHPNHTGSHRLNGIFIACGPSIKNVGNFGKISIFDVFPTTLYLCDIPIPECDGKVLKNILYKEGEEMPAEKNYELYSESLKSDDDEVRKILEDLGYL